MFNMQWTKADLLRIIFDRNLILIYNKFDPNSRKKDCNREPNLGEDRENI